MTESYEVAISWNSADMGSVPVWIGTVVTCVSLIIAVATFWRSQGDKRREHASKVGAWISEERGANNENLYFVNVANAGDVGAYEINVKDAKSGRLLARIPELSAKQTAKQPLKNYDESWDPIGRISEITLVPSLEGSDVQIRIADIPVGLDLRDALGRRWKINSKRKIRYVKNETRTKKPVF